MMGFRERVGICICCIGISLCMPSESLSQTIAATLATTPVAPASPAAPLETNKGIDGRLFFSAQERQRLDAARRRGLVVGDDGQPVQAPPSVLNGFVKRSDGSTALWVDGNVRWNAQGKNVASLVPSDVGGPAEYVKAIGGDTVVSAKKPVARGKKPVKPRAKAINAPRLLP